MTDVIRWPHKDMIAATIEHWGDDTIEAEDCEVAESDRDGEPCLIVVHTPTGRTSAEAGDVRGRWTWSGIAWSERNA